MNFYVEIFFMEIKENLYDNLNGLQFYFMRKN